MTRGLIERLILAALLLFGSSEAWTRVAATLAMTAGAVIECIVIRRRRRSSATAVRRAIEIPADAALEDPVLLDALTTARIRPRDLGLDATVSPLYDGARSSLQDR